MIVQHLVYSSSEPDFRLSFYESYHESGTRVQTSLNVNIPQHLNGHIPVVRDATVRWLGVLVVGTVHADMTLTGSKVKVKVTGVLNFRKLAKPCTHAGSDDRQPLPWLSGSSFS